MTMVAYFGELGLAISDLLLTRTGSGQWTFLPSVGYPPPEISGLPFHASRLVRKIVAITHRGQTTNCLIAGNVAQVDRLLNDVDGLASGDLTPAVHHPRLHPKELFSVLQCAAARARDRGEFDISLIGLRGEETIAIPTKDLTIPYFGRVLLLGSGADAFGEWLQSRGPEYAREFEVDSNENKHFRTAHFMPMQLLHADRMHNSVTLRRGVGGFYEVYFNLRGNLQPENAGWVRLIAEMGGRESEGVRLRGFWYHEYRKDTLVVASAADEDLQLSLDRPALLPLERLRVDAVPPYGRQPITLTPTASELIPRIPRARFQSIALQGGPLGNVLVIGMHTRNGYVVIERRTAGLSLQLVSERFSQLRVAGLTTTQRFRVGVLPVT